MIVAIKLAVWSSIAFPLWLVFSEILRDLGMPLPKGLGAALAWVAAGFILEMTLPLFGYQLGLPWVYVHPWWDPTQ